MTTVRVEVHCGKGRWNDTQPTSRPLLPSCAQKINKRCLNISRSYHKFLFELFMSDISSSFSARWKSLKKKTRRRKNFAEYFVVRRGYGCSCYKRLGGWFRVSAEAETVLSRSGEDSKRHWRMNPNIYLQQYPTTPTEIGKCALTFPGCPEHHPWPFIWKTRDANFSFPLFLH